MRQWIGSVTSYWHVVVIKAETDTRGSRQPQVAMHSHLLRFLVLSALFGFLLCTAAVFTTSMAHTCTYTVVRYCSIIESAPLLDENKTTDRHLYSGGAALCKASTVDSEISPTFPLIFAGGAKSAKFAT